VSLTPTRTQARTTESRWDRLNAATAGLDAPFAVVDLAAFDANATDLVRRAGGRPIRVASKSVRCRALVRRVLAQPGFQGVLAYTLA
jgi:D-serine deaminase-like pyridoxal phosphate-dependent protein